MSKAIYFADLNEYKKISDEKFNEIIKKYKDEYLELSNYETANLPFNTTRALYIEKEYMVLMDVNEGLLNDYLRVVARTKRNQECFPIINRGELWYDTLSDAQYEELKKWYQNWLDVTETLVEPKKPEWLK